MHIYGSDQLWYLVPTSSHAKRNTLLEDNLSDGFLFGKAILENDECGQLCVEILGDLEWACEVATYLEFMTGMCAVYKH
jgi:hypothetical protein